MTHPGFVDEEIKSISSYNKERLKELKILTSDKIKAWIVEKNIELIGYEEL